MHQLLGLGKMRKIGCCCVEDAALDGGDNVRFGLGVMRLVGGCIRGSKNA